MFCPKCGSIIKEYQSNKDSYRYDCSCGYSQKTKKEEHIKEEINNEKEKIEIHHIK